jgi:diamine N-acetyltransferase
LLQGDNITLRAIEPEDLEYLYNWENDPEIWLVGNTLSPLSRFTLKRYIENSHQDIYEAKQLRLMIVLKENNKTIGTIDIFDFDPFHLRAGLGILIADKNERNKGYAKETLKLIIDFCFKQLSIHTLFCNIAATNAKSLQLFESVGFLKCGTKKEWLSLNGKRVDEFLFQLINK